MATDKLQNRAKPKAPEASGEPMEKWKLKFPPTKVDKNTVVMRDFEVAVTSKKGPGKRVIVGVLDGCEAIAAFCTVEEIDSFHYNFRVAEVVAV